MTFCRITEEHNDPSEPALARLGVLEAGVVCSQQLYIYNCLEAGVVYL